MIRIARPHAASPDRQANMLGMLGRVAPGLTPWRSHRSGRAQLTHPVRHGRRDLAGEDRPSLSGRSSEVTVTRNEASKCSPWCPTLGPPVGSALSSPGSAEMRSPASTVLWRCATPWVPLAALRCLRLALPGVVPVVSLPAVHDAQPRAWGSISGPHCRTSAAGRQSGPFKELPFALALQIQDVVLA